MRYVVRDHSGDRVSAHKTLKVALKSHKSRANRRVFAVHNGDEYWVPLAGTHPVYRLKSEWWHAGVPTYVVVAVEAEFSVMCGEDDES